MEAEDPTAVLAVDVGGLGSVLHSLRVFAASGNMDDHLNVVLPELVLACAGRARLSACRAHMYAHARVLSAFRAQIRLIEQVEVPGNVRRSTLNAIAFIARCVLARMRCRVCVCAV